MGKAKNIKYLYIICLHVDFYSYSYYYWLSSFVQGHIPTSFQTKSDCDSIKCSSFVLCYLGYTAFKDI